MKAVDLYRYISDNNIEWHRQNNEGVEDVIIFPYTFQLEEFNDLIKNYHKDEGVPAVIKNGYLAIWMLDLCSYFDIDINDVFIGDDSL